MTDTTTIQVSRQARDHLAQITERLAADRKVVRDVIGLDISDEEFDQAPDVLGSIRRIAAEKARVARGAEAA
ncbi:hypothetical protein ACIRQQ_09450 [Streptomyces fuscichromogenes]|uniref:hypothetical protein n=1 Tax=Streptomyces fuscichromogenes TaxID=1324013 RepID=UPI003809A79E